MLSKTLSVVLGVFLIFGFVCNVIVAEENQQISTLIKGLKKDSSISEKVRRPLGKITEKKRENIDKIRKILVNKPKIDKEYERAVKAFFDIAQSKQENIAVRYLAFASLAELKTIDNSPRLNQQRKELFINLAKGKESPRLRSEAIMGGSCLFLYCRNKEHEKYPEYFQALRELFYNKNEHYMVRASAAYPLAYFNKFSGEKKKAIKTLLDILRSMPEKEIGFQFMGRVNISLKELTGKNLYDREWEEWYSKK